MDGHFFIILSLFGVAVLSPVHRERRCVSVQNHTATLTFFAGYDLTNTVQLDGFSVIRVSLNGTETERVVECFWFDKKQPWCLNQPGYKYKAVTDRLLITITNYHPEQHAGKYVFQAFPLDPEGNIECLLPQNSESHETSTVASPTSEKPEVDAKKTDGLSDSKNALPIVTVVLVSVTLVCVCVQGTVSVKNWWKTAHDSSEKQLQSLKPFL